MPISDVFSLFARTAADAVITVGACIAVVAILNDDSTAAPVEFAVASIPEMPTLGTDDRQALPTFAIRFAEAEAALMQVALMREAADRTSQPASPPQLRLASLSRRQTIVAAGPALSGIASTYNPNDPYDPDAGNKETASGEPYDAEDWTAAIQIELRDQFGGIRFGVNYQPAFVLVQTDDKQAIVRINDVGPLQPGRIIDLNERAMRYFDPDLLRGLLPDVRVTPLAGRDWVAGPVSEDLRVNVASGER